MQPSHVAITGASSGIGAELALQYAAAGSTLALFARRAEMLAEVAARCRELGAVVAIASGDIRDAEAVADWLEAADDRKPVDLIIVNAGVFDGHGPGPMFETAAEARAVIETNLIGTTNTVRAIVERLMARRAGRIALVGSLAALLPAADAPAYSASKAGMLAYAEALREFLFDYDVGVSMIMLGHVKTAQTANHAGSLPMLVSATEAARIIKRELDLARYLIVYPAKAAWLVRLARLLPWRLRIFVTKADRFHIAKKPP